MKPDAAVSGGTEMVNPSTDASSTSSSQSTSSSTAVDEADVEPCDLFIALGMLIVESRLPTPSVKGRRDGPHCPPALGHWTSVASHVCDPSFPQCERTARMQKQMHALWRNHIPMCIEVLLFAGCRHGEYRAANVDISPPDVSDSCILLEQWTIHSVARKLSDSYVSARSLFQAIRSYLHFSQLSAWLNSTRGMAPLHIGYRISPPGEFCTSRFSVTPENHVFPLSFLGKSLGIRTAVQLLPRLPEIPNPFCHELHSPNSGQSSSRLTDNEESSKLGARMKSPEPSSYTYEHSSSLNASSPRFTKPNVLNHELSSQQTGVTISDRCHCPCSDCRANSVHRDCLTARLGLNGSPRPLRSPDSPELSSCAGGSEDLGAVPKLELKNSSDAAAAATAVASAFESEKTFSLKNFLSYDDDSTRTSNRCVKSPDRLLEMLSTSPQLPGPVAASKPMTLEGPIRRVSRKHAGILKDPTDSNSSSPDIDAYLMKTMAGSRCDPLSPQEMDVYLNGLYRHHVRKVKSVSESRYAEDEEEEAGDIGDCPISVYGLQVDQQQLRKIPCKMNKFVDEIERYPSSKNSGYLTPRCGGGQTFGPAEAKQILSETIGKESALLSNGYSVKSSSAESFNECTDGDSVFADVSDAVDGADCAVAVVSCNGRAASRRLFEIDLDPQQCHAKFLVGSDYTDNSCATAERSAVADSSSSHSQKKIAPEQPSCVQGPMAIHKSVSCPNKKAFGVTAGLQKAGSLLKSVMKKELQHSAAAVPEVAEGNKTNGSVPSAEDTIAFRSSIQKSANMLFHSSTGLPLQSSPAPIKRLSSGSFDYDGSLTTVRAITNSFSCVNLDKHDLENGSADIAMRRTYSTSAPASTNCLLGNFEESMLNGRIEPSGVVEGFTVDISASGSFYPKHVTLPVTAFFFSLSDDNAPSPYLGHINLDNLPKRGYHVPKKGTIQVTLFNPNKTVVKIFVVVYDMSDMPPNSQTFLRQRTLYMPVKGAANDDASPNVMIYLRYLIHLRFASSKSGKIYLHTDIRIIFARDKFELDSRVANYELRTFTEVPVNPKYSPKR